MPDSVRAAVLTAPGKFELRSFPYPTANDDTIVARIRLAGVCGTDLHLFQGRNPNLPYPIILGHENLAEVVEIGKAARTAMEVNGQPLAPGDRIVFYPGRACGKCWFCRNTAPERYGPLCCGEGGGCYGLSMSCDEPPHLWGGFAEYVYLLPWVPVYRVPPDMPDEVAVLTDIFASAAGVLKTMAPYPALREGFGPAGTAAIQGAGPIGLAACVTARVCGAHRVILVGGPRHRLQVAERLGVVDHIVDIDEVPDPAERVRRVQALTPGGVGPDLVVDATGVAAALREGLEMVRCGGTYLESGSFVDTGEVSLNVFRHICSKDVYLLGHYGSPPSSYQTALRLIEQAYQRWHIPLDLLVTDRYSLERVQEAFESKLRLEGIKTVIQPRRSAP